MARRRTVSAQYRGKRVMQPAKRPERKGQEAPLTPGERRRLFRILVCGSIFVVLVAVKLLFPAHMAVLGRRAGALLEENMDVQAVFSAVGRRFAGEGAAGEIYRAVFGPEETEQREVAVFVSQDGATALDLLHTYQPAAEKEEEQVLYFDENLPEGVSMEQAILGFDYCTPVMGTLTSPFGYREHPIEGEDAFHYGLDLAANTGTAIACFADGTVGAVGESSSYGKYCIVEHEGGFSTLYAHCDSILASSGAAVKRGETIAKVGATGMATGSHLHFELLQNGVYLNPIYYVTCAAAV